MPQSICLNSQFFSAENPVLRPDNRSYRYGDGLFETMQVKGGRILLEDLHFERLFQALHQLGYKERSDLSPLNLRQLIFTLCDKNNCTQLARVRLSVSRGNGGIYDVETDPQYLIEAWPLDPSIHFLNEKGLAMDVYPLARKSCDVFSNLKSASHLSYSMAAVHARSQGFDDCLLLNTHGRIADSTIANVFIIKRDQIITPPLEEGCVAGVMRKYLLSQVNISEHPLTIEDISTADEVFLTNAIQGIRCVYQFRDRIFSRTRATELHEKLRSSLWVN